MEMENLLNTNDREIFFTVYEQDVVSRKDAPLESLYPTSWDDGWFKAKDKKMLIRTSHDGDKYLNVVNDKYRVVENKEVLLPLQTQMINYMQNTSFPS
jgi:hypothetical protein